MLPIILLILGFAIGSLLGISFSGSTTTVTSMSILEKTMSSTVYVTVERTTTVTSTIEIPTITTVTTITKTVYTGSESSCIIFRSVKDVYSMSEEVSFELENKCSFSLLLPNPSPWLIIDSSGKIVYSPIAVQIIREVKSGEKIVWRWDQKDNNGSQVPPGQYYVKLITVNAGIYMASFRIGE